VKRPHFHVVVAKYCALRDEYAGNMLAVIDIQTIDMTLQLRRCRCKKAKDGE
jgi:hypothetical protein